MSNAMTPSVDNQDELIAGEDWARADFYALLAQLYSGKTTDEFLARFRSMEWEQLDRTSPLGFEFGELVRAVEQTDAKSINQEFVDAFIGVGKPDVMLFGSYYMAGFLHEKPLVDLRDDLAKLGLTRDDAMIETEDHIGFLMEVMRYLILEDSPPIPVADQQAFFQKHIAPWYAKMTDAIEQSGNTDFFKTVGRLTHVFLDIETQSFDFESAV
jgi:TorA maturation chaperone TorD